MSDADDAPALQRTLAAEHAAVFVFGGARRARGRPRRAAAARRARRRRTTPTSQRRDRLRRRGRGCRRRPGRRRAGVRRCRAALTTPRPDRRPRRSGSSAPASATYAALVAATTGADRALGGRRARRDSGRARPRSADRPEPAARAAPARARLRSGHENAPDPGGPGARRPVLRGTPETFPEASATRGRWGNRPGPGTRGGWSTSLRAQSCNAGAEGVGHFVPHVSAMPKHEVTTRRAAPGSLGERVDHARPASPSV